MRRLGTTLAVLVLAGTGIAGAAGTAQAGTAAAAAEAVCETGWGSLEKRVAPTDDHKPPLTNIRTGQHECFDRMVLDFKGGATAGALGYRVKYVDKLTTPATGEIPVSGGAILQISVGPNYDPATGTDSYPGQHGQPLPGVDITGYQTFQDTRYADGLEDGVVVGVGVRARLPFRVTQSGDHLIVDVAHSWTAATS
ncbi:hypothetical protein SAMN04487983_102363 [Streptomyces sp. yr375]|uniref:AMIN-like domain-containing (lipo)protein n=1 Tax=Streptomyces sp. yr375 TaxID=1761906 RepID=UPI0008D3C4FB|nr:hypothetical protein [Streptomyces sp. yr375]SER84049.1 hypothetical protein SAMN04487983_102363 [Streptomyces sp. yr375]